jgi:hypothetical protein
VGAVGGLGYHVDRAERKQWLNVPVSRYASFLSREDFPDEDDKEDDDDADDIDRLGDLALPDWLDGALAPAVGVLLSTAKVGRVAFVRNNPSLHPRRPSLPAFARHHGSFGVCALAHCCRPGARGGFGRAQKLVTAAMLDALPDMPDHFASSRAAVAALVYGALKGSVLTLFSRRGDGGGGCAAHVDRGILTLVYAAEVGHSVLLSMLLRSPALPCSASPPPTPCPPSSNSCSARTLGQSRRHSASSRALSTRTVVVPAPSVRAPPSRPQPGLQILPPGTTGDGAALDASARAADAGAGGVTALVGATLAEALSRDASNGMAHQERPLFPTAT